MQFWVSQFITLLALIDSSTCSRGGRWWAGGGSTHRRDAAGGGWRGHPRASKRLLQPHLPGTAPAPHLLAQPLGVILLAVALEVGGGGAKLGLRKVWVGGVSGWLVNGGARAPALCCRSRCTQHAAALPQATGRRPARPRLQARPCARTSISCSLGLSPSWAAMSSSPRMERCRSASSPRRDSTNCRACSRGSVMGWVKVGWVPCSVVMRRYEEVQAGWWQAGRPPATRARPAGKPCTGPAPLTTHQLGGGQLLHHVIRQLAAGQRTVQLRAAAWAGGRQGCAVQLGKRGRGMACAAVTLRPLLATALVTSHQSTPHRAPARPAPVLLPPQLVEQGVGDLHLHRPAHCRVRVGVG